MKIEEDVVQTAVDKLEYAFRDKDNVQKVDLIHDNNFSKVLEELIKSYLTSSQARGIFYIWNRYERALSEARKNNLEQSQQLLSEVQAYHYQYDPESILYALSDVSALPMKAYLYYKNQNYETAEQLLHQSIVNDTQLVENGYFILEYHRIQQLHNINRLYFKQNLLIEGSEIIQQALAYILYEQIPSVGTGWSVESLQKSSEWLRTPMILQLLLETTGIFIYHNKQEKNLFKSAFRNLTFFDPRNDTEVAVLKWLELKQLYFLEENNIKFIVESLDFLATEPAELDILKLSLIDNLMSILPLTSAYNETLHRKITSFCERLKVSEKHKQFCLHRMEQVVNF